MKVTIVIPFFICAFSAASAQTTPPKILQEIIKGNPVTGQTAFTKILSEKIKPQATLLAVNEKGKVYALPQDNMPCLVPPKPGTAIIPNGNLFSLPHNTMPNAMRVQPVIPKR